MTHQLAQHIRQQLVQLTEKGRRSLSGMVYQQAIRAAWRYSLPVAVLVALCSLLFGLFSDVNLLFVLGIQLALPLLVFMLSYGLSRYHYQIDAKTALAFFDHQPGLKQRISIADEFSQLEARSAFHDAALHDAEPWIAQALLSSPDKPQLPAVWPQLGGKPWLLAVLCSWLVIGLLPQSYTLLWRDSPQSVLAESVIRPDINATAEPAATMLTEPSAVTTLLVAAGDSGTEESSSQSQQAVVDNSQAETNRSASAANPSALPAQGRPDSASGAQASSGISSDSRQQKDATPVSDNSSVNTASHTENSQKTDDMRRNGQQASKSAASGVLQQNAESGQADSAAGTDAADSSQQPDAQAEAASSTQQSSSGSSQESSGSSGRETAQRETPQNNRSGENQRSRSQRNNQSQQGQGEGQGQNPGQDGDNRGSNEGIKKTRGISGLLLAVPMADQLTGTVNPGRIQLSRRQAQPQAGETALQQAEQRGTLHGNIGSIPLKNMTAQEKQQVRNFFMMQRNGADNENDHKNGQEP